MIYVKHDENIYNRNKKEALEYCNAWSHTGVNLNGQRIYLFAELPDGKETVLYLQPEKPISPLDYEDIKYLEIPNPQLEAALKELAEKGCKHFIAVSDARLVRKEKRRDRLIDMQVSWCYVAQDNTGVEFTDFIYVERLEDGVDEVSSNEQLNDMIKRELNMDL